MKLDEARQQAKQEWDALWQGDKPVILVGSATCGRSAGALDALAALREALAKAGADAEVIETGCLGLCYAEPLIAIARPGRPTVWYSDVTPGRARELVEAYVVNGVALAAAALGTTGEGRIDGIPALHELPVLKPQVRRVLSRCGMIDPTRIAHYLATGGYTGLTRALAIGPDQVVEEVKTSGLRGRGGAGFPTWRKWQFSREAPGQPKYLVCNADEGDPGAFMNRSVLESDPHAMLEGMLIAAYAIGASEGTIYCRAEYPLALERLRHAIAQMRELGLLGENILGSGFSFDLRIKEGAGAFVCGEET
ncbi:MAG: NADH-quinone oxidoreductase subunit F, partial [Armatimonadetes bacterium]|nr:NADH-quinone oxidoreductase subunit F [Armatimonadota bacterium]